MPDNPPLTTDHNPFRCGRTVFGYNAREDLKYSKEN